MDTLPTHYMQSPSYARFMEKLGWNADIFKANGSRPLFIYSKKLSVFGSVMKIPRFYPPLPMEDIDILAHKKKALFVKVEPNVVFSGITPRDYFMTGSANELHALKFTPDSPIAPTKTIFVDLNPIAEKIEKSFKTDVRTSLRHAQKAQLISRESDDLDSFYNLFTLLAKERGFYSPFEAQMHYLWEAFKPNVRLIMTYQKPLEKNPRPLAGCFVLLHDGIAYYKYAASLPEGRKLGAPYMTLWKAMLTAKKAGCTCIDLEGITDERYKETFKYKGITHFKRSWNGFEVTYLGSFCKIYSPIYKIISLIGKP